ncbi:MAG: molybdenum cofactor biosynthesis protein B [bacterium]
MTALNCAVLTISDTRTLPQDTSGEYLSNALTAAGHTLHSRELVRDNVYDIRARVSAWIADDNVAVIITSGGTGFTGRDSTPEAITPLLDKVILGFGELFRTLSFEEIGSSTIQSRALGGLANATLIFCLPGSTGAARTGWEKIIRNQLDVNFKPCNFAELIPRFREQ